MRMCSEQFACVIVTRAGAGMYQHTGMVSLVGCSSATYGHGSSSENSLVLLYAIVCALTASRCGRVFLRSVTPSPECVHVFYFLRLASRRRVSSVIYGLQWGVRTLLLLNEIHAVV